MVLGPQGSKADALRAGAAEFLTLPTYLRDVIGVGKLTVLGSKAGKGQDPEGASELQTRLSEHYGLFYLLRAMASSERSGILALTRGNRRAELRIHEGTVVSASVGAMQGLPALHHLLLWEEAALSLTSRAIPKRSQLHLSAQEILDECERFLRDFAHAARDLGSPRTVYGAAAEPVAELRGLQPSQVTPLLRLFDGRRVLADVIEESPFRIFDTVRMIRRLRDARRAGRSARRAEPGAPRHAHRRWARQCPQERNAEVDARRVGDGPRSARRGRRPPDHQPAAPAPRSQGTGAGANSAHDQEGGERDRRDRGRQADPGARRRVGQLSGGGADGPGAARRQRGAGRAAAGAVRILHLSRRRERRPRSAPAIRVAGSPPSRTRPLPARASRTTS